jgi:methyl-accepting chemotaxis protein
MGQFDKAWKVYDALPQSTEEEKVWKQFVKDWDAWKQKQCGLHRPAVEGDTH